MSSKFAQFPNRALALRQWLTNSIIGQKESTEPLPNLHEMPIEILVPDVPEPILVEVGPYAAESTASILTKLKGATPVTNKIGAEYIQTDTLLIDGSTNPVSGNAVFDAIAAKNALATPFTPVGSIAATNVQAAIAELDGEKQTLDSDLTAYANAADSAARRVLIGAAAVADINADNLTGILPVSKGGTGGTTASVGTGGVLLGNQAVSTTSNVMFATVNGGTLGTAAYTASSAYATAAQGSDERIPTAAGLTTKFSTADATVIDADRMAIFDSTASFVPKHALLSTLWTWIKSKIDAGQTWAGTQVFSGPVTVSGLLTANSVQASTISASSSIDRTSTGIAFANMFFQAFGSGSDRKWGIGHDPEPFGNLPPSSFRVDYYNGASWEFAQAGFIPNGGLVCNQIRVVPRAVSQLSTLSSLLGNKGLVNNALNPVISSAVTAGGSKLCEVAYNGTAWIVTSILN